MLPSYSSPFSLSRMNCNRRTDQANVAHPLYRSLVPFPINSILILCGLGFPIFLGLPASAVISRIYHWAFFWLALRTLTFGFLYELYNKEAKCLTFRRGSEVSQDHAKPQTLKPDTDRHVLHMWKKASDS